MRCFLIFWRPRMDYFSCFTIAIFFLFVTRSRKSFLFEKIYIQFEFRLIWCNGILTYYRRHGQSAALQTFFAALECFFLVVKHWKLSIVASHIPFHDLNTNKLAAPRTLKVNENGPWLKKSGHPCTIAFNTTRAVGTPQKYLVWKTHWWVVRE